MDEKLIAHHMRTLKCTREEALALIADDKAVDKGKPMPWDLTAEQKANARKALRGTSTAPRKKTERTREPNTAKRALIALVADALAEYAPTVSNAERTVDFSYAGVNYTFTLTAHRAKKEGCE